MRVHEHSRATRRTLPLRAPARSYGLDGIQNSTTLPTCSRASAGAATFEDVVQAQGWSQAPAESAIASTAAMLSISSPGWAGCTHGHRLARWMFALMIVQKVDVDRLAVEPEHHALSCLKLARSTDVEPLSGRPESRLVDVPGIGGVLQCVRMRRMRGTCCETRAHRPSRTCCAACLNLIAPPDGSGGVGSRVLNRQWRGDQPPRRSDSRADDGDGEWLVVAPSVRCRP